MHKMPGHNFGKYYEEMATRACALALDHTLLLQMQDACRKRARQMWGYEQAADRFLEALKSDVS